MEKEDLIKMINKKIEQLEIEEKPNNLLKKALIKQGIITKEDEITEEQIQELFEILNKTIHK